MAAVGDWSDDVEHLREIESQLPDSVVRDRLRAITRIGCAASVAEIASQFGCSGYVAETVPLALFAAQRVCTDGFKGVVQEVIEVGGDTDTIASICGQIMGAYCGRSRIPPDLISRLPDEADLMTIAGKFAQTVTRAD